MPAAAAGAQKVASVRRASVGFLSVFFGFWGRVSFDLDTNGVWGPGEEEEEEGGGGELLEAALAFPDPCVYGRR